MQTTEFMCTNCMKGGICMGCKDVVLEVDASLVKQPTAPPAVLVPQPAGPTQDIEMADGTQTSLNATDSAWKPTRELLYRCFTCRRLAHYRHLPIPDTLETGDPASVDDIQLASFYQFETGWRCADCFSYEYTVDKILAWRPYPAGAVEPHYTLTNPPDAKSMLPREYLVKWSERSYRRTQWVPHMWLVSTTYMKLKNFITTGPKVELLANPLPEDKAMEVDLPVQPIAFEASAKQTPEVEARAVSSLGPLPDAERRIPPAWKTTDRVLDVLFWTVNTSGRGKRSKRNSVSENDEEVGFSLDLQDLVAKTQLSGEQPSDDYVESLDDYLHTVGKSQLDKKDIKFVAWAFIKWEDLGYDEGEYILSSVDCVT